MRIHVVERGDVSFKEDSCLVIPFFTDEPRQFGEIAGDTDRKYLDTLAVKGRVKGKAEETYYISTPSSPYGGILVLGVGEHETFDAEVMRRAAGQAASVFRAYGVAHAVLDGTVRDALPVEAFVEGLMLAQYDFTTYKKKAEDQMIRVEELVVVAPSSHGLEELRLGCGRTELLCECANWARDLGNIPANDLTPSALAARAAAMASEVECECTVLDEDDMRKLGMNAILAVGRGSSKSPKLIILHHTHPEATKTLALVGKGITFDSGGISIKPAKDMHEMKFDMCGAAAVLGAMKAICQSKAKVNVVCIVPASENKTGSDAQRPGDIIKAYNGKTIEVINTDAEGRLILADALAYTIEQYKPDAVVDAATLTGAVYVALGHFAAGVMATDDDLYADLELASGATGERIWRFPLWDDYEKLLESPHADLSNVGPPGEAGAIVAACFLKEFLDDTPWAHFDIAGTAWGVKNVSYLKTSDATGYGVRLFSQWVLNQA